MSETFRGLITRVEWVGQGMDPVKLLIRCDSANGPNGLLVCHAYAYGPLAAFVNAYEGSLTEALFVRERGPHLYRVVQIWEAGSNEVSEPMLPGKQDPDPVPVERPSRPDLKGPVLSVSFLDGKPAQLMVETQSEPRAIAYAYAGDRLTLWLTDWQDKHGRQSYLTALIRDEGRDIPRYRVETLWSDGVEVTDLPRVKWTRLAARTPLDVCAQCGAVFMVQETSGPDWKKQHERSHEPSIRPRQPWHSGRR